MWPCDWHAFCDDYGEEASVSISPREGLQYL